MTMYLDGVKARFEELHLVRREKIIPCTEREIQLLEQQLGLPLPGAYQEFLLWMGHGAGGFLRGSDCFYDRLPPLRAWAAALEHVLHLPPVLLTPLRRIQHQRPDFYTQEVMPLLAR